MTFAENILYLIPLNKPWNSGKMIKEWMDYGGIVHSRYYANGGTLGFPINFACGAVHFQRGYTGPMYSSIYGRNLKVFLKRNLLLDTGSRKL